jgi:hypothetical protein
MLGRECHVGEDVRFGLVQEDGELGQLGTQLVGDPAPLGLGGLASSWANAVAMKADTTRRLFLPAWATAFLMKWTRQRCQQACSTLADPLRSRGMRSSTVPARVSQSRSR